jgi:nucleolar protein 14
MLEESDSDDSDLEVSSRRQNSSADKKPRRSEVSGDDLGENFEMDEDEPKKGWVDEVLARGCSEEEESDNEDDSGSGEDEDNNDDNDDDNSDRTDPEGDGSSESGCDDDESEAKGSDDDAWERSDEDDELPFPKAQNLEVVKPQNHNSSKGPSYEEGGKGGSELPFVIDAPKSFEALKSLVDNRSVADLLVIIQRIRTCNSIHLAAENRRKMQV